MRQQQLGKVVWKLSLKPQQQGAAHCVQDMGMGGQVYDRESAMNMAMGGAAGTAAALAVPLLQVPGSFPCGFTWLHCSLVSL